MKVAGIIAEYNPFHRGHQYHIEETRRRTGASHCVAVLSGSFVQRGAPAMLPTALRARMALLGGADLVLELPPACSVQSAEYFAAHGVGLLDALGCVDVLSFGSECGDLAALMQTADVLFCESGEFRQCLRDNLRQGLTWPAARQKAAACCFPPAANILAAPNNILAVEYLMALRRLRSPIKPHTVRRQGADYHSDGLGSLPSAEAIRRAVRENPAATTDFLAGIPSNMHSLWTAPAGRPELLWEDDFSSVLHWKLYASSREEIAACQDVGEDMANRIYRTRDQFLSFSQYAALLKSRNQTATRTARALFHILLDIRGASSVPYARILGFRKSALPLLAEIKKNSRIPMIGRLSQASEILNPDALSVLEQNIRISHLYETVSSEKYRRPFVNEYTRQIVILP